MKHMCVQYFLTIKKNKEMHACQIFEECTKVLKELTKAAALARSEVAQLLVVLEGPAAVTNATPKVQISGQPTL